MTTWPSHKFDGLTKRNTDPFADYEVDDNGGCKLEDDVDDCEEDTYQDVDWL